MEIIGFIVFFGITCMILLSLGYCRIAGNNTKDEKRFGIETPEERFNRLAWEAQEAFNKRLDEGKAVLAIQNDHYEDKNVLLIDSRLTFNCPFNYQWLEDTVKVNSGYCRSACKRRNYTVKSPGDHFVACNKGCCK